MKKFEKIVTWIQEEVRSGRMVSGEKLPSEQELSEQFQVSPSDGTTGIGRISKREYCGEQTRKWLLYM